MIGDWKIDSGTMTEAEYQQEMKEIEHQEFTSRFRFLNDHRGLRQAELSLIIGPKGGGKSSLVRTMITELLVQQRRVYVFLSEEKTQRYKAPIYHAIRQGVGGKLNPSIILENLFLESQIDFDQNQANYDNFMNALEMKISELMVDVVIFDNFTTSFICSMPFKYQAMAVTQFKRIAAKRNIVFLMVTHTGKGTDIYDKIIDGENVRGDATQVNIGSYNYIITTFFRLDTPRVFLSIDKARYHGKANKQVYELFYDPEVGLFTKDMKSSPEQIQAVINSVKKRQKKMKVDL